MVGLTHAPATFHDAVFQNLYDEGVTRRLLVLTSIGSSTPPSPPIVVGDLVPGDMIAVPPIQKRAVPSWLSLLSLFSGFCWCYSLLLFSLSIIFLSPAVVATFCL